MTVARETKSRASQPPPKPAADPAGLLSELAERAAKSFAERQQILTYDEYLGLVLAEPRVHLRDAATYLRDAFDHHGWFEEQHPWGRTTRYRIFDQPFQDGRERLVGQEPAQAAFYRAISGFVRDGRANRLILLHGPNGSSKTTFVQCIVRALENYSSTAAGALYRFHWVFPTDKIERGGGLGFGDGSRPSSRRVESYARLEEGDVDARLTCEVRDHPLLLLPEAHRREVIAAATAGREAERLPEMVVRSGLCHKCRQIFDALSAAYAGDLRRVLAHVQVERFTISRGYRRGAITIGPQMSVDAAERQITADRSLGALPTALQNVAMFEPYGELVDGAGGIVVFDDLLKRPLDAFKYLLTTIEDGEVTLGHSILRINAVLAATSNEVHLEAFRRHPEFPSFRGRLALIRVPYLREIPLEREIYELHIVPQIDGHVAPHAIETAARWAVMTRLGRPDPAKYEAPVTRLLEDLTVDGKAALYAGEVPVEGLEPDELKALRGAIPALRAEHGEETDYEGLTGASPREVRSVLLLAAQRPGTACLSPFGVGRDREPSRHGRTTSIQRPARRAASTTRKRCSVARAGVDRIEDDVRTVGAVDAERSRRWSTGTSRKCGTG